MMSVPRVCRKRKKKSRVRSEVEPVNALVEERWLATLSLEIEPRLRRIMDCKHLPKWRAAIKRDLKLEVAV